MSEEVTHRGSTANMKVYISGKITGVDHYLDNFNKAEKLLKEYGMTVVNPAKVMFELPDDTPRQCYMDMSIAMLKYCDAILMLHGWGQSAGAREEYKYAVKNGKKVFYIGAREDYIYCGS